MDPVICPLCLTMFLSEASEGDECIKCNMGELINFEDYVLRIDSSFMEIVSRDRNTGNDQ